MYKNCDSGILLGTMETKKIAGFLLINKPKDISSFACIRVLQKLLGQKKGIGHTGTLDPFATGLLIIALDRTATKHIDKFLKLDKTYIAKGKLGELTDTLDYTGTVIAKSNALHFTQDNILDALKELGKEYLQTPPLFAALKHQGTPLYQLARDQELSHEELTAITKQKQRMVLFHALELLDFSVPYFTLKAHVSHGTYIRSLLNDIAKLAGSCATTYELERTAIGKFNVEQAVELDELKTFEDVVHQIISIDDMLKLL